MKKHLLLVILLCTGTAQAQQRSVDDQLHRIFASRDFASERFGPARWLDPTCYTTLERSATGQGTDIVKYDVDSGQRTVMVSAAQLTPPNASQSLGIADYIWSPD